MSAKIRFVLLFSVIAASLSYTPIANADDFGSGANEFTISFTTIDGDSNPSSGFGIVENDFRISLYEVTNGQWDKFVSSYGTVTGTPSSAYDANATYTGANIPANGISWYEAAQFVNWLNSNSGHQVAYKFTGTQGTANYALDTWDAEDAAGTNLYRHKDAMYYLPTEDEWVKAAFWNGTNLQTYSLQSEDSLTQGNGSGTGWNYYDNGYALNPAGPWEIGSGSEELNYSYDMMGNILEWTESPYYDPDYSTNANRCIRNGSYADEFITLGSSFRVSVSHDLDTDSCGFRVASAPIPSNGDANKDSMVDLLDLIRLRENYGTTTDATWEMGDFDTDGDVDIFDFLTLKAEYGNGCTIINYFERNSSRYTISDLSTTEHNLPVFHTAAVATTPSATHEPDPVVNNRKVAFQFVDGDAVLGWSGASIYLYNTSTNAWVYQASAPSTIRQMWLLRD